MKKRIIEMILIAILAVSALIFALNIKRTKTDGINNVADEYKEAREATLLAEDDSEFDKDLYGSSRTIKDDVFNKYFVKNVGEDVYFLDNLAYKYKSVFEGATDYVKGRMRVNYVETETEYKGEQSEEDWVFLIIDITAYNDYDEERILYYRGDVAEWNPEETKYADRKDGYQLYKLDVDSDIERYNGVEQSGESVWLPMGERGYGFSVEPGKSVEYKAIFKVMKQSVNNELVFYERVNRSYATNRDFAIRLFRK